LPSVSCVFSCFLPPPVSLMPPPVSQPLIRRCPPKPLIPQSVRCRRNIAPPILTGTMISPDRARFGPTLRIRLPAGTCAPIDRLFSKASKCLSGCPVRPRWRCKIFVFEKNIFCPAEHLPGTTHRGVSHLFRWALECLPVSFATGWIADGSGSPRGRKRAYYYE